MGPYRGGCILWAHRAGSVPVHLSTKHWWVDAQRERTGEETGRQDSSAGSRFRDTVPIFRLVPHPGNRLVLLLFDAF